MTLQALKPAQIYDEFEILPPIVIIEHLQYATVEQDDEKFMTPVNLIRDYLGMQKVEEYNETTLNLLAGCVDQTKDGYVHFIWKLLSNFSKVPKKFIL